MSSRTKGYSTNGVVIVKVVVGIEVEVIVVATQPRRSVASSPLLSPPLRARRG